MSEKTSRFGRETLELGEMHGNPPARFVRALTLIVAFMASLDVPIGGQANRRSLPRTPCGDPDLQGIWPSRNSAEATFQRPENLAEATVLRELIDGGRALIVETTNLNGKTGARMNGDEAPTSERLRIAERFIPVDAYTLRYEVTLDDPGTWTRSWTVAYPLQRQSSCAVSEYACHEGNYGRANILSAGRAAEKAAR